VFIQAYKSDFIDLHLKKQKAGESFRHEIRLISDHLSLEEESGVERGCNQLILFSHSLIFSIRRGSKTNL